MSTGAMGFPRIEIACTAPRVGRLSPLVTSQFSTQKSLAAAVANLLISA